MAMQIVPPSPAAAGEAPRLIPRDRFLRLQEVESLLGCKKSTIYSMLKNGELPSPIRLGARMVVWSEATILQFIQDRINGAQTSALALTSFTTVQGVQA